MKNSLVVFGIIAAIVVILGGWIISQRNALIALDEDVNEAWSNIDTDLAEIYLSPEFVLIDPAPFTLDASTPLAKAYALFNLLQLSVCVITQKGNFVGLLFKNDFHTVYQSDYRVQETKQAESKNKKPKQA